MYTSLSAKCNSVFMHAPTSKLLSFSVTSCRSNGSATSWDKKVLFTHTKTEQLYYHSGYSQYCSLTRKLSNSTITADTHNTVLLACNFSPETCRLYVGPKHPSVRKVTLGLSLKTERLTDSVWSGAEVKAAGAWNKSFNSVCYKA